MIRSAPGFQLTTLPCWVEHENRIVGDSIDEKLEPTLGLLQLGGRRGKLPCTIGNTCFQALIERQQPGFQSFAFADLVIDARYPTRPTRLVPCDLAFAGDPMNAAVRVSDPKFT